MGSRERLESQAREFQSYLWECLHTLNWKDTSGAYRDAYGTAALILALCESEKLDDNSGKFNVVDSIRTLDMGLLLGSEFMRPILQEFASNLQKRYMIMSRDNANIGRQQRNQVQQIQQHQTSQPQQQQQVPPAKRRRQSGYRTAAPSYACPPVTLPVGPGPKSLCTPVQRLSRPALADFYHEYLLPGTPCVLTGCIDHWPAFQGPRCWKNLFYLKTG